MHGVIARVGGDDIGQLARHLILKLHDLVDYLIKEADR